MKMRMNEAIARAIDEQNAGLAGAVCEALRAQGRNYNQVLARVREVRPAVSDSDWEDLMHESDDLDAGERA